MTTTDPTATRVTPGEFRMLLDGSLVEATGGGAFDNVNPATEEVLGQTTDATAPDMDRAIGAARRSFDETTWSTDRTLRQRCLRQLQEAIVGEQEQLRAELVAEVGTPVTITYLAQLDAPLAESLLWPAAYIDTFEWERPLPDNATFGVPSWQKVVKEPVGVVGAIIPWNYPIEILLGKLGQALATGNTVVVKPAPDTPWNATRIGRLIAEQTDIPDGVVNVVPSSDHQLGEQLVVDPRVDLISFTGSTATGRRIMAAGAPTLKRLFLELGGKSADIILEDGDLETKMAFLGFMCMHAGQGCAMLTRTLVHESRYEEAVALAEASMGTVTYGDPTDPANIMGPVISARQRDRVLGYVASGVDEGARLVCGGGRPAHLDKGFYVEPTLFADVDNSMRIAREEIFGPVLVMIPFRDEDDAVRIANDSEYGLSGGVTSASEERAIAVARRIRAGTVSVNGGIYYNPASPFGGYKASGLGRQNGNEGFEQYLETKTIAGGL
ncbi:MAG TPA: aldehyde dehydrogenase family protein [Acidimicrobiales bacterium]